MLGDQSRGGQQGEIGETRTARLDIDRLHLKSSYPKKNYP
jgi:hypothetical protein